MLNAVVVANSTVCELGESPVWDPVRERLLWLDVGRGLVLLGRLHSFGRVERVDHVSLPATVSSIAVAEDGRWLIVGEQEIYAHPRRSANRSLRVIPCGQSRRLSDGKPDPAGRFVVGTSSPGRTSVREMLLRVEGGDVSLIDDDLSLSNGLAWSADGATMYSIDTMRRRVYARSYDARTGIVGSRRVVVEATDGYPDGMCTDADGYLWVAMWGLGKVHRYSPEGHLDRVLNVPAPHVSSVAFAGKDLSTLVVTTATHGLTKKQLAAYPLSGRLFTAKPGVKGAPVSMWDGHLNTASV